MPKFLRLFVALLIVPCLLADPALASAGAHSVQQKFLLQNFFQSQALAAPQVAACGHPIEQVVDSARIQDLTASRLDYALQKASDANPASDHDQAAPKLSRNIAMGLGLVFFLAVWNFVLDTAPPVALLGYAGVAFFTIAPFFFEGFEIIQSFFQSHDRRSSRTGNKRGLNRVRKMFATVLILVIWPWASMQIQQSGFNAIATVTAPAPQPIVWHADLTPERIHHLYETRQLDDMFNGLRSNPDLLYRYLSEIQRSDMREFSRYFASLQPRTRQCVFDIFYHRLRHNMEVLENGTEIKKALFQKDYVQLAQETERMTLLYATMAQMLNRTTSLWPGDLPDGPVAPLPDLAMTREQAVHGLSSMMEQTIAQFRQEGYEVTLPSPQQINLVETTGLIQYYTKEDSNGFFVKDNQADALLRWVLDQTDPSNPTAHKVTDREVFAEAMRLHNSGKSIDLFKVLATIGHYYKAMARAPDLIEGGRRARDPNGELPLNLDMSISGNRALSGGMFIWQHHLTLDLAWSLDPNNINTVNENGEPVMQGYLRWMDGNEPDHFKNFIYYTEADRYHAWNFALMDLYTQLKTFQEILDDQRNFQKAHPDVEGVRKSELDPHRLFAFFAYSSDLPKLNPIYKVMQTLHISEWGLMHASFSNREKISMSKDRSKIIWADAVREIYSNLVEKEHIVRLVDHSEQLLPLGQFKSQVEGLKLKIVANLPASSVSRTAALHHNARHRLRTAA